MRRLLAALVLLGVLAGAASAATHAQITVFAAASLTDVFPQIDSGERYSFGGSNTLSAQIQQGAPADVFASANMTLPERAAREGALLEARRLHAQHARDRRADVEPGRHPQRLRPDAERHQARRRRLGRARRQLHAPDPQEHEPVVGRAQERRQPGDGRARGAREGRARRGRRRLRLRHRRQDRARQGEGGQGAGLGAAEGPVRDLRRRRAAATRRTRRRSSTGCSRRPARRSCSRPASCRA